MYSREPRLFLITQGARIAQMVILQHSEEEIIEVEELDTLLSDFIGIGNFLFRPFPTGAGSAVENQSASGSS